ncbi:LLM class flavin-dependent oxidoreductase [Nocardia sp. NBC_01503]|uniref:LLM class flavin-dependent oxidoreductase n=1 Tax=Nocardia sp. NBC_01503 TaxID=2975997 RepID=UPI002E7BD6F9|nr:LLM class flavin-dependent oxidoreductase [Nocardia sp. NBC_01503]WTL33152.1 LLM class flavin-dependent oxidoreductase [Nocardia sp. NBC_01503]
MKFSMIFEAQMTDPTAAHEAQVLRDSVEQAVLADQVGFDTVWAVEHHGLKWYAHMSAPEIFLTWVAARTERIRIGHGVVCMPFNFNHPVRAAERAAMLDVLSGGRVNLGAGRGATAVETSMCGVDPARTYQEVEESLRMIAAAWQHPENEFSYHGELLDIEPHHLLPRPVQRPHPPLFMACTKKDTLKLAADYGIGALVLGFAGIEEIAELRRIYDTALAERTGERFVSTVVNDHFAALCPTIVLDDRERARQIGARGQRFFAQAIKHYYGAGPVPDEAVEPGVDQMAKMREAAEEHVAYLHEAKIPVKSGSTAIFNTEHAYGNAEDAVAYVERLRDAGADEILCLIQMGTVPQDACMETIRQWGEHVIPHFRNK